MPPQSQAPVKPRLGISACLLGERVRYDGAHKLDAALRDALGPFVEWVPVCPEVECGLNVPREAMRLVEEKGTVPLTAQRGQSPFLRLVTRKTGIDHTARMKSWAAKRLDELEKLNLDGFVLKARSPSCGMCVEVCDASGTPCATGRGLWARAIAERFPALPVEEDERLRDASVREKFLERVLLHRKGRREKH